MARPLKEGLDYFSLDCYMDSKMKLIQAEYGLKGFAIVVKLWQMIYREHGYYSEWNDEKALLFAYEECSDCGVKLLNEIVETCFRRDIFSEKLFRKYRILTSSGIQKRYFLAVDRRRKNEVKEEYLLVEFGQKQVNEAKTPVNVSKNSVNADNNTQSKVKESKYYYSNPDLNREFCLYLDMRNHTGPTLSAEQINALKEELDSLAENDSDKLGIVRKAFGGGYKSFFPTSKKRKKSTPKPKKEETIHNFTQREVKDCEFENLEKKLLKKQLGGDITYG